METVDVVSEVEDTAEEQQCYAVTSWRWYRQWRASHSTGTWGR